MWFGNKPVVAVAMALLTLLILGDAAIGDSDWTERIGTVANAVTLPDGSHVYLDCEQIFKIRGKEYPAYIVINEFFSQDRIGVITPASPLLKFREPVDIEGDMCTLNDGSRAIINAKVYGYTDIFGNLLYDGILKGLDAPLPWDWKVDLTVYSVETCGFVRAEDDGEPAPPGGIDTTGVDIYQTDTIADAVNQPLGTVIQLCSKPITSVDSGSLTLAEDDTTNTLQVSYSNAATDCDPSYRTAVLVGTLDTDGTNPVLDVDSGPNYYPQESFQGNLQMAYPGTVGIAKTYPDGAQMTLGTTSAGEIVTRAWPIASTLRTMTVPVA